MTCSVAALLDCASVVPRLIRSDEKSLCRLALPDPGIDLAEGPGRATEGPKEGVPGIGEEGVRSPLSEPPRLGLPTKAFTNSSRSLRTDVDPVGYSHKPFKKYRRNLGFHTSAALLSVSAFCLSARAFLRSASLARFASISALRLSDIVRYEFNVQLKVATLYVLVIPTSQTQVFAVPTAVNSNVVDNSFVSS